MATRRLTVESGERVAPDTVGDCALGVEFTVFLLLLQGVGLHVDLPLHLQRMFFQDKSQHAPVET